MNIARPRPGPVALVGSGEYLPQMNEIDRMLLDSLGEGPKRVALLPTASGLELEPVMHFDLERGKLKA